VISQPSRQRRNRSHGGSFPRERTHAHRAQGAASDRAAAGGPRLGALVFGWTFALGDVAAVPHESWDLPDPRSLPIDRLREVRDRLRERVWRLVARQGWYKLQPARMLRFNAEQSQHA